MKQILTTSLAIIVSISLIFGAFTVSALNRCVDVKDNGYQPFSKVKDNVKSKYIDEKYKELVLAMQKDAQIIINDTF